MAQKDYIKPTKQHPIFQVVNTYVGYVVNDNGYKEWEITNESLCTRGYTTATSFQEAMDSLFMHIKENSDYKKSTFAIEMIDGSVNEYGEPIRVKCYSITMRQAKKFRII